MEGERFGYIQDRVSLGWSHALAQLDFDLQNVLRLKQRNKYMKSASNVQRNIKFVGGYRFARSRLE
jgi:hypothetical protein